MTKLLRRAFALCGTVSLTLLMVMTQPMAQGDSLGISKLNNKEKKAKVLDDIKRIRKTLAFAKERLDKARTNQDIIQLNCVNDKLSGIQGFLKIAEEAGRGLENALRKGDQDLIDHEFRKVAIAAVRVENWKLEVEGCVGELSQYTGNSDVTVAVDPDIRADDPVASDFRPAFEALNVARPPAVTGSE